MAAYLTDSMGNVTNKPGENGDQATLETKHCVVGHTWQAEAGTKQRICPVHAGWWQGQFPAELRPNERTVEEWDHAERELVNERGYAVRWRGVWTETARRSAALLESWEAVDIELVDDYVRARRLEELHRLFAQDEPYSHTAAGGTKPHPGWRLSREAGRDARRLARELGISVPPMSDDDAPKKSRPGRMDTAADLEGGQNGGVLDNQVGPDGRPL
jgi:hypothetical protein